MHLRATAGVAVLLAIAAACAGNPPERPHEPSARSTSAVGAPPRPDASTDAKTSAPDAGLDAAAPSSPSARSCDPGEALARGRAATVAKAYDRAIAAFDEAVRVKPYKATLRAERGYARYLAGNAAAAEVDLLDAASLTHDTALLAQIWFNLGLAEDALHESSKARMAFVRAERAGSKAAARKLDERKASRCPAVARVGILQDAPIYKGFTELAAARAMVNCVLPALENPNASARERACRGCAYGNTDKGNQCQGKSPFAIASGHMHMHDHTFYVFPMGGDFYYALNAADAVVPPDVRIGSDYVRTQSEYALGEGGFTFHSGGRELVYGRFEHEDAFVTITGKWSDEPSDEEPRPDAGRAPCKVDTSSEVELGHATGADVTGTPMFPLVGPTFVTYDDRRSRKRVLELDVYAGDVSVTFAAGKATLRGEGCSDVLTLP